MDDANDSVTLPLSLSLSNPTLIEWLSAIPEEKRAEAVESTLFAGHVGTRCRE